jgi:cysteine desulfurase
MRLPNTLSLAFPGIQAASLLQRIGDRVAASAGSACHAGTIHVSSVLTAMGVEEDRAIGTVRFSTGRWTTPEEVDMAAEVVTIEVKKMKST